MQGDANILGIPMSFCPVIDGTLWNVNVDIRQVVAAMSIIGGG